MFYIFYTLSLLFFFLGIAFLFIMLKKFNKEKDNLKYQESSLRNRYKISFKFFMLPNILFLLFIVFGIIASIIGK